MNGNNSVLQARTYRVLSGNSISDISIATPANNALVSSNGFLLAGDLLSNAPNIAEVRVSSYDTDRNQYIMYNKFAQCNGLLKNGTA